MGHPNANGLLFPERYDAARAQKETHWSGCAKPWSGGNGEAGEKREMGWEKKKLGSGVRRG